MAPSYKLTYFDLTALGEPIRFLLKYGNIEFEDVRVKIGDESWEKEFKPKMPFGQMPVLEIDGKPLCQHLAICRLLAKNVGLAGSDDFEAAQIDMIADCINDFRLKLVPTFWEKDEVLKEKLYKEALETHIPFYLTRLDKIAKENNGYFVNGKLSWVDLQFVSLIPTLNKISRMDNIIENSKNLKELQMNVESVPSIKKWLEDRPKTWF